MPLPSMTVLPLFERYAAAGSLAIDLYPLALRPVIDERSDLICKSVAGALGAFHFTRGTRGVTVDGLPPPTPTPTPTPQTTQLMTAYTGHRRGHPLFVHSRSY